MLTEHRRMELKRSREIRKAERETGHIEIAEDAIVYGPNGAALAQMRMVDRLLHRQHGSMRHAKLLERRVRGLVTRHRGEPSFDLGHQRVDIFQAIGVETKTRVLEHLGLAHRLAQRAKMMVERRDDDEVAILRLEHTTRQCIPGMLARTRRLELAFGEAVRLDRGLVVM